MLNLIIAMGLIGLAIYGFKRRTDATAGTLLAVLLLSIPITYNLPAKGLIISAMAYLEAGLAIAMFAFWVKWISQRARAVWMLSVAKFWLLMIMRQNAIADDGWWMAAMLIDNALLVAQLLIAGGMADGVVRWFDRVDPASARDRNNNAPSVVA